MEFLSSFSGLLLPKDAQALSSLSSMSPSRKPKVYETKQITKFIEENLLFLLKNIELFQISIEENLKLTVDFIHYIQSNYFYNNAKDKDL